MVAVNPRRCKLKNLYRGTSQVLVILFACLGSVDLLQRSHNLPWQAPHLDRACESKGSTRPCGGQCQLGSDGSRHRYCTNLSNRTLFGRGRIKVDLRRCKGRGMPQLLDTLLSATAEWTATLDTNDYCRRMEIWCITVSIVGSRQHSA